MALGSENPAKVRAVSRVVSAPVVAVAVDSGVPEQPRGHAETVAGAEHRARNALAAVDAAYGVGIEGGVAEFEGAPGLYLVMWAAVTDGDRTERGAGPSLRLPADVAAEVRAGAELGPVMADVVGEDDVARREGAAGALTGGRVTRADALTDAVAVAFGPFETAYY
ncbi:MAG: inosine/xanthosine triphosphatase [Haloferacaceae archaeon]